MWPATLTQHTDSSRQATPTATHYWKQTSQLHIKQHVKKETQTNKKAEKNLSNKQAKELGQKKRL